MKTIIYAFCSLVLLIAGSSCEKYLDAPSQSSFSDEIVFKNEKLTENMIFNIYSYFAQTNSHRGRYQPLFGMNTDIEIFNPTEIDDRSVLSTYSASATNAQMSGTKDPNPWSSFYNAIEAANICIRGIKEYGNPQPDNNMGYFYAEAVALRAVYYYDLLRAWGDIPARFEPVQPSTIYMKKSDRDVIYKKLIADLGEIENYLPWPNGSTRTSTVERMNRAFVKAFRARLCLMAAGYAQRPANLETDHTGSVIRLSNDPELQKNVLYKIAKEELEDVINSNSCKLEPNFVDIFIKNCQDVVKAGEEPLFELPFAAGRGRMLQTFGVYHYDASKYIASTKKGGTNVPSPTFFYDFDPQDIRRDITCVPYKWQKAKQVVNTDGDKAGWNWGKYRFEWMAKVRLVSGDDGLKQIYMRYGDVLLMYAEVVNELDNDQTTAKKQLELIRRRAFPQSLWPEKVTAYLNNLTSKEEIFNAIVDERAFELGGEMLRKQDLIRWNLLGARLSLTKNRMQQLKSKSDRYSAVPDLVYYRLKSDGESLEFYGFNPGESGIPAGGNWSSIDWQNQVITDKRISTYFQNDPDKKQFWPIFQSDIDSQVGYLINDYGY